MARKVFLSFLGSNNYGECKYTNGNYTSANVRYIQEATLQWLNVSKWNNDDIAYIMLTTGEKGSLLKNWEDNGHKDRTNNKTIQQTGLKSDLLKHKFPINIEGIEIPNGNNEDEIWNIFTRIFNLLEEKDQLYIDITHGFRYLPMLSIVLSNYSKFLKNTEVKSITYGNFEGRNIELNEAPIIELISFSKLQDWTLAASNFLNLGRPELLSQLTQKSVTPLLKESKGKDLAAQALKTISKELNIFFENVSLCRGKSIGKGKEVSAIECAFENVDATIIPAFNPLFEKIKTEIKSLNNKDEIKNGLAADEWCLNNHLIQQGITILNENILTIGVSLIESLDINNISHRTLMSSCMNIIEFNIPKEKWNSVACENDQLTEEIVSNEQILIIAKSYVELSAVRNDINHAGWRQNPLSSKNFGKKLKEQLKFFKSFIQ